MANLKEIEEILISVVLSIKNKVDVNFNFLKVEQKSYQDYVTELDYLIESYLIDELSKRLPNIQVFSEEKITEVINISNLNCVVIDPVDGTQNAMCGLPMYATSIAYIEDGMPKIGITYDLTRDELFYASLGFGMFVNKLNVNKSLISIDKKPIMISNNFLMRCAELKPEAIKKIRNIAKIRMLASETIHLAYLASGRLRANFNFEAKFWDDAAGFVMLNEVGMSYTNFNGENIFPKKYIDPKENLMSLSCNKEDLELFLQELNFFNQKI